MAVAYGFGLPPVRVAGCCHPGALPCSMEAGYSYRFYPTNEQAQMLARTFGCARFAYNWALRLRSDAYQNEGQTLSYGDTSKRLTALKKTEDHAWLNEVSSVPVQQALRHLDAAYRRFFRKKSRFPRFKSRRSKQSAEYTTSGYRVKDSGMKGQPLVYLAKMTGPLKVRWSRPLPSAPKTIHVSRDRAGRYFVSFQVADDPKPFARTKRSAGVDLGLKDIVVTVDDLGQMWKSGNPRHHRRDLAHLKRAQRGLARKQKGSANREKARRKVARLHARVRDRRQDFLHKLSTRLVRDYDRIAVEDLAVKNMVRNRSLAQAISDAGWGELLRQLRYKAEWYGKEVVVVDRFYPSSKRCSGCGWINAALALSDRRWTCEECGAEHDRDGNACMNILAAGHAAAASGDGVGRGSAAHLSVKEESTPPRGVECQVLGSRH